MPVSVDISTLEQQKEFRCAVVQVTFTHPVTTATQTRYIRVEEGTQTEAQVRSQIQNKYAEWVTAHRRRNP